jgi:hypothetical protein
MVLHASNPRPLVPYLLPRVWQMSFSIRTVPGAGDRAPAMRVRVIKGAPDLRRGTRRVGAVSCHGARTTSARTRKGHLGYHHSRQTTGSR